MKQKIQRWTTAQVDYLRAMIKAMLTAFFKKAKGEVVNGHPDVTDGGLPVTVSISTVRQAKWHRRALVAETIMLVVAVGGLLLLAKVEQGVIETQTRVIKQQRAELVAQQARFERASRLVNEAQEAKSKWDFERSKRLYRNAQLALTGK